MADKKIGTVVHYFNHIGVAAIILDADLKVGDKIKFMKHDQLLFEQEVVSMQKEHEAVTQADKGEDIGLKTDQVVHEGVDIYKIS